jgi:hypothetical protein
MKRKEILALCASNPEAIVIYIESQESKIKELRNNKYIISSISVTIYNAG